jgi:signal peptidase I
MSPLIRRDDLVMIEPAEAERVRFGDVIAFESAGQRVIHRVMGKRRRQEKLVFLQKGDLNAEIGEVPAEHVLGRVTRVRRGERTVNLVSRGGRVLQVALAICSAGLGIAKAAIEQAASRLGR